MRRRSISSEDIEEPSGLASIEEEQHSSHGEDTAVNSSEHQAHEPLLAQANSSPVDRYSLVYFGFFCLGMGTLLPWNFFISVNGFWDYKFRHINDTSNGDSMSKSQTQLQKAFASYLAIASNVPNAIFVILNAIYGQRFCLKLRIFWSLGFIIIFFSIVSAFARTNSDSWQTEFLMTVLSLVVFINICTAIYQGAVFGVAGKFPPVHMGSVMAGQAMGGIFPAIVNIVFLSVDVQEKDVGFACFFVATLFLVGCFGAFLLMRKSSFFCAYADDPSVPDQSPEHHGTVPISIIFHRSWIYCLSVWITFGITLSAFPAITVLVESQYLYPKYVHTGSINSWATTYFTPVTCFLLFNCCDYFGRLAASHLLWPGRRRREQYILLALSIARLIFLPLFMFCNAAPSKRSLPILIHSDNIYILLMILFAFSNGYLGNICMLHGPKTSGASLDRSVSEDDPDLQEAIARRHQEATAMLLVACLVIGTGTGSFLSYGLIKLL